VLSWLFRNLRRLFGKAQAEPERSSFRTSTPPVRRRPAPWLGVAVVRGDAVHPVGPCWLPCHPRTRKQFKAEMICRRGHRLVLSKHRVAADGTVYPSVVCQTPGCSYHEIVRLVGWDGGDLP